MASRKGTITNCSKDYCPSAASEISVSSQRVLIDFNNIRCDKAFVKSTFSSLIGGLTGQRYLKNMKNSKIAQVIKNCLIKHF